ncbi:MAG: DUF4349 domain-containing protein [Chitinophagaceae bacterium]
MKFIYSTVFIAVLSIILSCNTNKSSDAKFKIAGLNLVTPEPAAGNTDKEFSGTFISDSIAQQEDPGTQQKKQPAKQAPVVNPDWDKKIIKNATLNAQVKDYNSFYTSLREKVKGLGGFIAQEEQTQSDYKFENSLVIKVPVDQFDNALTQLTGITEKINEKKVTSQDVTTEVIDTKSRMEAKRQVRLRYIDLLKEAKNMQEILNVQSEINGVQEEIESAAGRIQYLGHSSSFSTINLTYYQILNVSAKDKETETPSFGTRLSSAFRAGGNWMGELFVGIVSIWPLLLVIAAVVIIYRRTKIPKTKQA